MEYGIISFVVGVISIICGIALLNYYSNMVKKGGLSFKLRNGAFFMVMIGAYIVFKSLNK